jgi:hypothetical protein
MPVQKCTSCAPNKIFPKTLPPHLPPPPPKLCRKLVPPWADLETMSKLDTKRVRHFYAYLTENSFNAVEIDLDLGRAYAL